MTLEIGDIVELRIEDLSDDGQGIGKINGLAIFIMGTTAGDFVTAKIVKKKKNYLIGELIEIIFPSRHRIHSCCKYFNICGGCTMDNISYEKELEIKENQVANKLQRIGNFADLAISEIIKSDSVERYRNKATFGVSVENGQPKVGFFARGTNEIVECEDCKIQKKPAMKVANIIRELVKKNIITVYDKKTKKGFLREIKTRVCEGTNEIMVILTGAYENLKNSEYIVKSLDETISDNLYSLESVILEEKKKSIYEAPSKVKVLAGKRTVCDEVSINGKKLRFEIGPEAFYQVNTEAMVKLYEAAINSFKFQGDEIILDLYSGIGTIGLSLAEQVGKVVGIEVVPEAVLNANRNSVINGIVNSIYCKGKVEDILPKALDELSAQGKRIVAILDPPRKGLDGEIVKVINENGINDVIYISCNPATLARDLKAFAACGFGVEGVVPVDMFPRTSNVETIALLSKLKTNHYLDIEIGEDELSEIDFSKEATYGEIKKYVLDKYGLKVSSLYIAQIKRKHGLIERENYNFSKKENQRVPNCPEEKEKAIEDALEHFGMI